MSRIQIETIVHTTPKKTWHLWTSPEHIVKWNYATEEWHCPQAKQDFRSGGKFSFTMASKDGMMSFEFEGTYNDVIPFTKIDYTLGDGRMVTVYFEESGNFTRVIERFEPEPINSQEIQQAGWQAILNNFKKYVEENNV